MSSLMSLNGLTGVTVSFDPGARAVAAEILTRAAEIQTVADELDSDLATKAIRDINGHLKALETARQTIKAPLLEVTRQIDGAAKDHAAPLLAEKDRLERLAGAFIEKQRREREEAERQARAAEQERLRRLAEEQAAAERAAIEAGKTEQQVAAVVVETTRAALTEVGEIRAAARASTPVPKGAGVRHQTRWEIVDEAELLRAVPQVFVPSDVKINALIKTLREGQQVPGLRIWTETKATVR